MRQFPQRRDVNPAHVAVIPSSEGFMVSSGPWQLLLVSCTFETASAAAHVMQWCQLPACHRQVF
jgi:hypothetical protein